MFALIFGCLFLIVGLGYFLYPLLMIKEGISTKGIITKVETAIPNKIAKNNSKWAIIKIIIDDKEYFSKFIQVNMSKNIGENIEVIYEKNNPSKMCLKNRFGISIIFLIIGILLVFYGLF